MYHPTQKELIREALETQIVVICGQGVLPEIHLYSPERWEELHAWYENIVLTHKSAGTGFRMAHLSFNNRYTKDNLIHWLKTGDYIPVTKINGPTVLNFLQSRNSTIDFMRDTLEVVIEDGVVVVKVVDKVSGGSSTHVTNLDPKTFEIQYGVS